MIFLSKKSQLLQLQVRKTQPSRDSALNSPSNPTQGRNTATATATSASQKLVIDKILMMHFSLLPFRPKSTTAPSCKNYSKSGFLNSLPIQSRSTQHGPRSQPSGPFAPQHHQDKSKGLQDEALEQRSVEGEGKRCDIPDILSPIKRSVWLTRDSWNRQNRRSRKRHAQNPLPTSSHQTRPPQPGKAETDYTVCTASPYYEYLCWKGWSTEDCGRGSPHGRRRPGHCG